MYVVQAFVGNFTIIHGDSMLPVLHDGDIIWAMKNRWHEYFIAPLKQNDLVIVNKNKNVFIKRIVALPNDSVEIKDNKLLINNTNYLPPQAFISKRMNPKPERALEFRVYLKENAIHFSNAENGLYLLTTTQDKFDEIESQGFISTTLQLSNINKLKKNMAIKLNNNADSLAYFVLSQDLKFGRDSRDFGPVTESEISHKAMFLIFSRNRTSFSKNNKYTFFKRL